MRKIHDFCHRRLIAMLVITSIVGWMFLGFAMLISEGELAEFVFPPTSVVQAGFGIFIAGLITILFIPFYWLQMKLLGHVTSRFDYVRSISVINAYVFVVAIILFVGGFFMGRIAPPVFMVTPGVYFSLWLFKLILR